MKLLKSLAPLATATAVAAAVLVTPAAQAGVTASVGIANMYLWRGLNEGGGSQVSGELKWTKDKLYFGTWVSSSVAGSETDLFIGMSGKTGALSYDVSYWNYLYPEAGGTGPNTGLMDTNQAEIIGSISQGPLSAALYINVDGDTPDDNYLTLGYAWDKYTATFGLWMLEGPGGDEYTHITVTYAATDALTFSVSKAFSDVGVGGVEEDPLVAVSYGWNFDLKK